MVQPKKLIHRIGHRGAFLAFLALLDILYGYALLVTPGPFKNVTYIFPMSIWGFIWLAIGLFLTTGVPTRHDRIHFGVAATVKALWAAAWADAWLFQHYSRGWISVVVWAAFSALVVIVSSWPEMRRHSCSSNGEKEK